jgi:hypothetical protein
MIETLILLIFLFAAQCFFGIERLFYFNYIYICGIVTILTLNMPDDVSWWKYNVVRQEIYSVYTDTDIYNLIIIIIISDITYL